MFALLPSLTYYIYMFSPQLPLLFVLHRCNNFHIYEKIKNDAMNNTVLYVELKKQRITNLVEFLPPTISLTLLPRGNHCRIFYFTSCSDCPGQEEGCCPRFSASPVASSLCCWKPSLDWGTRAWNEKTSPLKPGVGWAGAGGKGELSLQT